MFKKGKRQEDGPCIYGYLDDTALSQDEISTRLDTILSDTNHNVDEDLYSSEIDEDENEFEHHEKKYIIAIRHMKTTKGMKYLGKIIIGNHVSYFAVIRPKGADGRGSTMVASSTDLYKSIMKFNKL